MIAPGAHGDDAGSSTPAAWRSVLPAAVWVVTRAALIAVLVHGLVHAPGDRWTQSLFLTGDLTSHYWPAASHLVAGQVPYRSFAYEYPPGSLPVLAVARWLGHSPVSFSVAWVALMAVVDGGVALVLGRRGHARQALWLWLLVVPLIGPVALGRNDMLVAAAFIVGFVLLQRGRNAAAGGLLAFGILAKIWPVVPLAISIIGRGRGRFRTLAGAGAVLVVTAALLAALGALRPMLTSLAAYHGDRPLEIESTWAVALMLAAASRGHLVRQTYSFGSINLAPGAVPSGVHTAAYALTAVTEIAAVVVAVLFAVRARRGLGAGSVAWLSLATVAAGLVVAPVLSPQYELWVLAAVCAVVLVDGGVLARVVCWLTAASALATQIEFPFNFRSLTQQKLPAVIVTGLRDALLLAVAMVAIVATGRSMRSAPQAEVSVEPAHIPPATSRIAPVT